MHRVKGRLHVLACCFCLLCCRRLLSSLVLQSCKPIPGGPPASSPDLCSCGVLGFRSLQLEGGGLQVTAAVGWEAAGRSCCAEPRLACSACPSHWGSADACGQHLSAQGDASPPRCKLAVKSVALLWLAGPPQILRTFVQGGPRLTWRQLTSFQSCSTAPGAELPCQVKPIVSELVVIGGASAQHVQLLHRHVLLSGDLPMTCLALQRSPASKACQAWTGPP